MDFSEKLRDADKMLLDGYTGQAVLAAGQALEALLQQLYQTITPRLKAKDQQTVSQKLEQVGNGKAVPELTLGQLVGLFREAALFDKAEAVLGQRLPRMRAADYNGLVELRNRAAHAGSGEAIEDDEARLLISQVRIFAREAGLLGAPRPEIRGSVTAATTLRPWSQVVKLHPDVEGGQTATAIYAIDLGALVAGDKSVPAVYREAEAFFHATYPTTSMVALVQESLARLTGGPGDRVLQLRSPFGGGKSHLLAALYHATQSRDQMESAWPQARKWTNPGAVHVAVFDGEKFDVQGREMAPGVRVQTMWGWIAWRLGGAPLYERVRYHDERRVAPGGEVIAALLGRGETPPPPTLIMLDEVLKYFERAQAETLAVGDSTLGRQTLDFIQSLSTEVAHAPNAVLIYSLQASAGEAFGNVALLNMLDHLTAKVDAKREPVVGDEILPVLQRRLLNAAPPRETAEAVATTYAALVTGNRVAQSRGSAEKQAAQEEAVALRRRFQAAYPFHPALIDLMKERWASLPDFQRTRGALRFLSTCLHALKDGSGALLGPGDVPLANGTAQHAFFAEVGQREAFKAAVEADFTGPNSRTRRIDERLAAEFPHLRGVRPATRLATAILMYSFGGLQRPGPEQNQTVATGATEPELLAAVIGPDLDGLTAQTALKALREDCLFLHFDGVRYVFKTTPNITQLVEQEFNDVKDDEVEKLIETELGTRLGGRQALVWPKDSASVDDRVPHFIIVYLPLAFTSWGEARQAKYALELLQMHGDQLRHYRNALGLAVPNWQQIEVLRRAVRYVRAAERLRGKKAQLNLNTEQMAQLKERQDTEKGKADGAYRELYNALWLPALVEGRIEIDRVDIGARPLSATTMHERLMELLTIVHHKVFTTLTPQKLVALLRLGDAPGPDLTRVLGLRTSQIRDAFFETLDFTRVENEAVIRQAIARGVKDGLFGYVGRVDRIQADRVREGSGYLIPQAQAKLESDLPTDEIDLDNGFVVLPEALEAKALPAGAATDSPTPPVTTPATPAPPAATTMPGGSGPAAMRTRVALRMRLNRAQLYQTYNALANLADKAGAIEVSVTADSMQGFDPVWLRNAVQEPLDEAGIDVSET